MVKSTYCSAIATSLLLVLAAGPLSAILDRHSVERQPWHEHIYLSPFGMDHHHNHHHHRGHDHNHGAAAADHAGSPVVSITAGQASTVYWALMSVALVVLLLQAIIMEPGVMIRRLLARGLEIKLRIPPSP